MTLEDIQNVVFQHIKDAALPEAVYYPNVAYKDAPTGNHYRVTVIPAGVVTGGLSSGPVTKSYLIQVDVMTRAGTGVTISARMVGAILGLFPRGLVLGSALRFDKVGAAAPALMGGAWYQTPISIPCIVLE